MDIHCPLVVPWVQRPVNDTAGKTPSCRTPGLCDALGPPFSRHFGSVIIGRQPCCDKIFWVIVSGFSRLWFTFVSIVLLIIVLVIAVVLAGQCQRDSLCLRKSGLGALCQREKGEKTYTWDTGSDIVH